MDQQKVLLIGGASVVAALIVGVAIGVSIRPPPPNVAAPPAAAALAPAVRPDPPRAPPSAPAPPPLAAAPAPVAQGGDTPARERLGDAEAAANIAQRSPADRDRALCAIEAQANPSITGAALARNADRYTGEVVAFNGEVYEVQDAPGGGTFLRVSMGSSSHVNAVLAPVAPPDTVLERVRVRVWGRMAGTYSYTSRAGWNITIPKVIAFAVLPRRDAPNCGR